MLFFQYNKNCGFMKMLVIIGIVNLTSYLRRVNVHDFYKQPKIWAGAYVSHLALKNFW